MASSIVGKFSAEKLPASESRSSCGQSTAVERDIDGVPLKDHKKIDLKSILGHTPDVEEDEEETSLVAGQSQQSSGVLTLPGVSGDVDEYEYGYSDDDEAREEEYEDSEGRSPRKIQRRSSLKAIHPPELGDESPSYKKAVRFADALGLGLAAVKDLINADEPPEIPQSALRDLRIRKKRSKLGDQFHLALNFRQPSSDPEFMTRLHQQKVVLENCLACDRELTVSGVVRVANISYEKQVTVRYTVDSWKTVKDCLAVYVPNSNDGVTDRFMFTIHLPVGFGQASSGDSRVEFAILFKAGQDVYWDNNDSQNYVVNCCLSPLSPTRAELESSGSEGEFII